MGFNIFEYLIQSILNCRAGIHFWFSFPFCALIPIDTIENKRPRYSKDSESKANFKRSKIVRKIRKKRKNTTQYETSTKSNKQATTLEAAAN